MFLSKNKKNNVYPCKPQFYCVKMGFKDVKIIYRCVFCDVTAGRLRLIERFSVCVLISHKAPVTTAADHVFFYFSDKILLDISCEWSVRQFIKCQALFFIK